MFDDQVLKIAAQGFTVSLVCALVLMPGCIAVARRFGIVDKPGGRKTHEKVTPLLGGVGVVLASAAGYLVVRLQSAQLDQDLDFAAIDFVVAGSLVLFLIGLIDDVFKDSMDFQPKLLGQVIGVAVLMWPTLQGFMEDGAPPEKWFYQLFFLGWYLTVVNSFNFSDNMNGLMSGLSVIALGAAILYLQHQESVRTMMVAVALVGAVVGFMPYNFPRSRLFLGDAGSMYIGFWMAWIQFDLVDGFMAEAKVDYGLNNLVAAALIMGVPLFDAAFVVCMRLVEHRKIYLGDNKHLSHRLVRGGFTPAEAVFILWGLGLILAWLGVLAAGSGLAFRYMILGASLIFMVAVTRRIMALERTELAARAPGPGAARLLEPGAVPEGGRGEVEMRSAR